MRLTKLTAIAAFAIMTASSAIARDPVPEANDTFELYGEVDGWKIYKVLELESCLAEIKDEAGNVLQMGLTKNHKHGYLGVFTLSDAEIRNRERIEIDIDGYVFDGRVKKIKSRKLEGDYSGGYVVVKDNNLATAIAEGQTLIAFPKRSSAFSIDLTGTKKAIEEGRKCNLAIAG